jgi:uncharacterized protein YciI
MQIALAVLALTCASATAATPSGGLYAVVVRTGSAWDPSKPAASQLHFKEHSANIRRLGVEGKLALGGRFGDLGLLVVRAASESEARSLFDADPSVASGTFRGEVNEFRTFAPGCVEAPKAATPAPPEGQ